MLISVHIQGRGIKGSPAPSLGVTEWFNLPHGEKSFDISNFGGKVIYLYCFQAWCPGCHKYGFPTLQQVQERYKDDPNVGIMAVQTVFEGFSSNTLQRGKEISKQYKLDIPFGQSGTPSERSTVMSRYRTGGTPWTIIIDKNGVVQYNDFHISPEKAFGLIDELKGE